MSSTSHRRNLSIEVTPHSGQSDLEIFSPTPRAFTFAIDTDSVRTPSSSSFFTEPASNMNSSPSPEPVESPFETIIRGWSPTSETESDTSGTYSDYASSGQRSGAATPDSSIASLPKKGDKEYIKRPENAFILFRRWVCAETKTKSQGKRQADLSKTISQQWKELSAAERKVWEDLAAEKKAEHQAKYPDYVYRPQRKNKKAKNVDADEDSEDPSFYVNVPIPGRRQRSTVRAAPYSKAPRGTPSPSPASDSDSQFEFRPYTTEPEASYSPAPFVSTRFGSYFSSDSDSSSPISPQDDDLIWSPAESIVGPFSQMYTSPITPDTPYSFSQPTIVMDENPYAVYDQGAFQNNQSWDDVRLWEGVERYDMSTAECMLGLPQDANMEVGPEHAVDERFAPSQYYPDGYEHASFSLEYEDVVGFENTGSN